MDEVVVMMRIVKMERLMGESVGRSGILSSSIKFACFMVMQDGTGERRWKQGGPSWLGHGGGRGSWCWLAWLVAGRNVMRRAGVRESVLIG
jgi:hypothetical protein